MTKTGKPDLDAVTATVRGAFPKLDALEQNLLLELYRMLAEGQPVPRGTLARRLGVAEDTVERILGGWPGVFSDLERRVVGYWGLALPSAYASPHRFAVGGQRFSAWCAWDTIFLTELLGRTAEVESARPDQGGLVRLTVTPERVERVDPADARMSFLLPDAAAVQKDVVTSFCHFVHFFPSRHAGESWTARHPGTFTLFDRRSARSGLPEKPGAISGGLAMIEHSVITCPSCGFAKRETMPTNACQFFYECEACGALLRPNAGDCCVFCSFGSVSCPPVQAAQSGKSTGCCSS